MPIRVEWGNVEQTTLNFAFVNPWTWDEFYEMQNRIIDLCRNMDYPIDAIIDMSKGRSLPSNALTHLSKGAAKIPANQGIIITVGTDGFLRSMADMVVGRAPHLKGKVYHLKTFEEAHALIAQTQTNRKSMV